MQAKICCYINDKGMVMPIALAFLAILAIVGTASTVLTTNDLKMSGYDKTGKQALYVSEAGIEEARARLKADAVNLITDTQPTQSQWSVFIGSESKSVKKGYQVGNSMHTRLTSVQTALDYAVRIQHRVNSIGQILYYGDSDGDGLYEKNTTTGQNIFLVSSTGNSVSSTRNLEAEITKMPDITVPAALYVEAPTTIQGSTNVIGFDPCGGMDLPGIVTTQSSGSVTINGAPVVDGTTPIQYNSTDMDVQSIVDTFKGLADFSYDVVSETQTNSTIPGPGDGWGTPTPGATLQDPSSCSEANVVYYDTNGTDIKLSGATGCGVLVVDGDLEFSGDLSWYGVIIATGSIMYTGGGNKNTTGAMIAGGSTIADVIGGNSNIIYCSQAITNQTANRALIFLTWNEKM